MSRFTERLIVSPLEDGKTWVVLNPNFGYAIGHKQSGERVDVPRGFCTDFASVPAWLRGILPKWDTYGNASVIHDWLYWDQGKSVDPTGRSFDLSNRRDCDRIMLEAMEVLEVPRLRRFAIHGALYLFGRFAWRSNQRLALSGHQKIRPTHDLLAKLNPSGAIIVPPSYA